jgi:hypothetical protein
MLGDVCGNVGRIFFFFSIRQRDARGIGDPADGAKKFAIERYPMTTTTTTTSTATIQEQRGDFCLDRSRGFFGVQSCPIEWPPLSKVFIPQQHSLPLSTLLCERSPRHC